MNDTQKNQSEVSLTPFTVYAPGMDAAPKPVKNKLFSQKTPSSHLCVVLPGRSYHCEKPLLYYTTLALVESGVEVLQVEYEFPNAEKVTEAVFEDALFAAVAASVRHVIEHRKFERITFVGKSLGTWAMARMLEEKTFLQSLHLRSCEGPWSALRCIWLTPLWNHPRAFEKMRKWDGPSLHIIGSADQHFSPEHLEIVKEGPSTKVLTIANADHGLDVEGSVEKSLDAIREAVRAVRAFL